MSQIISYKKFDMHTHSDNSHDGSFSVADMAKSAKEKGVEGICITDHCDIFLCKDEDVALRTKKSVSAALEADNKYGVRVLHGIEIGESYWYPEYTDKILSMCSYDAIIGSVHSIDNEKWNIPYARIDFSCWSADELYRFMDIYFDNMNKMLDMLDFDILAHLTCPLRYINGKYGRNIDATRFFDEISGILERIIKRKIALEINTSETDRKLNATMPYEWIIDMYVKLGGSIVTIGSDAHITSDVGKEFDKAVNIVKNAGLDCYYYFENRHPVACTL